MSLISLSLSWEFILKRAVYFINVLWIINKSERCLRGRHSRYLIILLCFVFIDNNLVSPCVFSTLFFICVRPKHSYFNWYQRKEYYLEILYVKVTFLVKKRYELWRSKVLYLLIDERINFDVCKSSLKDWFVQQGIDDAIKEKKPTSLEEGRWV